MDELNTEGKSTARINCRIEGSAVDALADLKRRGIVRNNREAVVQALLALQERVVKSDLEKSKLRTLTQQSVHLRDWDEIVGTLDGIESTRSDTDVIALLTCTIEKHIAIAIERDFPETEQQLRKLLGKRVAILKTDNPQKPLAIRIIPENNKYKTRPNSSVTLQGESTDHQQNALCTITETEQHTTRQSRDKRIQRIDSVAISTLPRGID
jgi:hypothetical protein